MDISTATGDRYGVVIKASEESLEHMRLNVVIAVNKSKVVAICSCNSSISSRGKSTVLFMHDQNTLIAFCPGVTEQTATVSRAIVDKHDLQALESLTDKTLDTAI